MLRVTATIICLLMLFAAIPSLAATQRKKVYSVTGVVGRSASLPCYLNPRTPGDTVKLILWYKKGRRAPVFSFDGRVPQLEQDIRTEDGVLTVTHTEATLTLNQVTLGHAGLYECRTDFFASPTRSNFVSVTVIEPPRSVEVLDSRMGAPKHGVLGPYKEGTMVIFTCLARSGSPLPNVTWWGGGVVVYGGWEVSGPRLVRNDLVVSRLTRDWHNDSLTCTATNTHLAQPASITITVTMYLLPTSVVISGPGAVEEGEVARLRCTSRGSRPPAQLSWALGGTPVIAERENTVYGGTTSSTLALNVTRLHHGATVTCTAANTAAPTHSITNTTSLNVLYPPSVVASLGRSLQGSFLKEGDDVYFTCLVDANPPPSTITWYHEGQRQLQNVSGGVILSGDSLVVQSAGRTRAGRYHCRATNTLATVTSNTVNLRIRYVPECHTSPTTYFLYDKPINVTCTVASYPPVPHIQWQWNSSSEVVHTRPLARHHDLSTAQLTVEPEGEGGEDRALSCWAVNEMGSQIKPCSFSIKVAKTPLPLSSCRLANITASSLSLTCTRPNTVAAATSLYRAEVYFDNYTLFANVTSDRPNFNVSHLDADTSYQIKVYVSHGPVTSQPVVVSAYTSRTSRRNTVVVRETRVSNVGLAMGAVGVVVLVLAVVAWTRHYHASSTTSTTRPRPDTTKQDFRPPSEDTNPDVVPSLEDTYDLMATGAGRSDEALYPAADARHTPRPPETACEEGQQVVVSGYQCEDYQPLVLRSTVLEGGRTPSGAKTSTYCAVDQILEAEESMV